MTAPPRARAADPTHAGGVVYRERLGTVEYLLVQAKSPLREWVLPKGHIERDETPRDAAVREVQEEAGVAAAIVDALDTIEYTLREKLIRVQFFLMRALHASGDHEAERACAWLPLDAARQSLAYEAYRELLALAERKRKRPGS